MVYLHQETFSRFLNTTYLGEKWIHRFRVQPQNGFESQTFKLVNGLLARLIFARKSFKLKLCKVTLTLFICIAILRFSSNILLYVKINILTNNLNVKVNLFFVTISRLNHLTYHHEILHTMVSGI